jgi:hypothetical protein
LHCASQQNRELDFRNGSKADIAARPRNVCFTPKSGHTRRFHPFEITLICAIGTSLVNEFPIPAVSF